MCRVNSINLQATYKNETSIICSVDMNTVRQNKSFLINDVIKIFINQLMLPDGVGQKPVDVTIHWVGPNVDHPIDAVTPVSGMLATILAYTLFMHAHLH